ncbi:hypothetical protein STA3757_47530 [Stanieria sp. NIES-3757]|nr:hypothetical protein STA3757_47530 [Stanieria sp. NIES-3757]
MSNYTPVSCDLYDQLEAIATLKQECTITYKQENGQWAKAKGRIVDVYAADGADWCKLSNDTVIRLDKIEEFEFN